MIGSPQSAPSVTPAAVTVHRTTISGTPLSRDPKKKRKSLPTAKITAVTRLNRFTANLLPPHPFYVRKHKQTELPLENVVLFDATPKRTKVKIKTDGTNCCCTLNALHCGQVLNCRFKDVYLPKGRYTRM